MWNWQWKVQVNVLMNCIKEISTLTHPTLSSHTLPYLPSYTFTPLPVFTKQQRIFSLWQLRRSTILTLWHILCLYTNSWVDFVDYLEGAQPKARSESKVRIEPKPVESERPTTWPTPKGSTRTTKQEPPRSLAHHEQKPLWEQRKPLGVRSASKFISFVYWEVYYKISKLSRY